MKTTRIWSILVLSLGLLICSTKLNAQDRIYEGDSEVEVIDTGDGYITFEEDGLERMRLYNGRLGIGTTTPAERIHVYGGNLMVENHDTTVSFRGNCYSNLNRSAAVYFYRSRGTKAAPLAITTNDAMGFLGFVGYDGTGYSPSQAYFKASADGPWTPTSNPTHMLFATCAAGSTTAQPRLFIDDTGYVGIGTVTPANPLDVESSTSDPVIRGENTYTGGRRGIAVEGVSAPADGYGIGGRFTGGYDGVEGYVYPTGSGVYTGVYGSVSSMTGGGAGSGSTATLTLVILESLHTSMVSMGTPVVMEPTMVSLGTLMARPDRPTLVSMVRLVALEPTMLATFTATSVSMEISAKAVVPSR